MATLNDAAALVAFRLGNKKGLDSIIKSELKAAKRKLELNDTFQPSFLLSERNFNTTNIGDRRLTLPTGFIAEFEDGAFWVLNPQDNIWHPLEKGDNDDLTLKYPGSGFPKAYSLVGRKYIRFFPQPDEQYQVEVICYKQTREFEDTTDNPWFDEGMEWIVNTAAFQVATTSKVRDAVKFQQQAIGARNNLYTADEAIKHTNREYVMGGD